MRVTKIKGTEYNGVKDVVFVLKTSFKNMSFFIRLTILH